MSRVCTRVSQSCLTLCDPVDGSPPGSSVHWILQARTLEWVITPFLLRGSSQPGDQAHVSYVSCTGRWVLYHECHLGLSISYPLPSPLPPTALRASGNGVWKNYSDPQVKEPDRKESGSHRTVSCSLKDALLPPASGPLHTLISQARTHPLFTLHYQPFHPSPCQLLLILQTSA